jgi:hypothetical protein
MAGTYQQHLCQHGSAKGFLNPSLLPPPLVCPQAQVRLEFPLDVLHGPSAVVGTAHLSRAPLVQIGHEDFCRCRAQVPPSFTQHPRDSTAVPQPHAWARHPEGFTARGAREAGHPPAVSILARQRRHQVFARFILNRLPWPGQGEDKAPASRGISGSALLHPLAIRLGALGGGAFPQDSGSPCGRRNRPNHFTEQGIVSAIRRMVFRPTEPKRSRQALDVPRGAQPRPADTAQPGRMLTFAPCVGHRIPRAPLRLLTASPHQRQPPILGRRQRMQGFLGPPCHQQMDTPSARLQQATEPPRSARGRRPTRQLCQGLLAREEGLPAHQPTQAKPVTTFPAARHSAKAPRDKQGHRGDGKQSRPRRVKGGSNPAPGILAVLYSHIPLSTLMCKAS